jgi:hypothetical protein
MVSPLKKKTFKNAMSVNMIITGRMPRSAVFGFIFDRLKQVTSTMNINTNAGSTFAMSNNVMYTIVSINLVRGSSLWTTVFPGKY